MPAFGRSEIRSGSPAPMPVMPLNMPASATRGAVGGARQRSSTAGELDFRAQSKSPAQSPSQSGGGNALRPVRRSTAPLFSNDSSSSEEEEEEEEESEEGETTLRPFRKRTIKGRQQLASPSPANNNNNNSGSDPAAANGNGKMATSVARAELGIRRLSMGQQQLPSSTTAEMMPRSRKNSAAAGGIGSSGTFVLSWLYGHLYISREKQDSLLPPF
jgi:hypothetical protein